MKNNLELNQPQRLYTLIIDLIIIGIACNYLFDIYYPPIGEKGYWAYAAILSVLVGAKLITPFFVKPADAIAYAVPAFVSLMLINQWDSWNESHKLAFLIACNISSFIILLGIINIIFNSFKNDIAKRMSNILRITLDYIGQPEIIYTPIVIFYLITFHYDAPKEIITIFIVLFLTVWWSLGNFIVSYIKRIFSTFTNSEDYNFLYKLHAYQEPSIVLLSNDLTSIISKNEILLLNDHSNSQNLLMILDSVGRVDNLLIRGLKIGNVIKKPESKYTAPGAYEISFQSIENICKTNGIELDKHKGIVGLVSKDSKIEKLYFEIVDNNNIEKGRLVSTIVGNKKVLYQIIEGFTTEEIITQKNTCGFLIGQAQQVGIWDEEDQKFKQCQWLPLINTPVLLEEQDNFQADVNTVGHFPKTNYKVNIKNINELVTHNTAILGILGVGKTMLSIELVERILADDIKVIVIDLTDEYKDLLSNYCDSSFQEKIKSKVEYVSNSFNKKVCKNVEEGGSISQYNELIDVLLEEFVGDVKLNFLVINPSDHDIWKQDSKPYGETASMMSLTPTEITKIISDSVLRILQKKGKAVDGKARVCLVYEEAHSLIPEWNSIVAPGDKNATNGTARAILQGRKFGLGCLLITQRTANVTKTILNQCNTIFAMRTFDETGKEFLSNYIGKDYASSLSTLKERQAIFYGKASSCENPVLIRLNDRDKFLEKFTEITES